MSDIFSSSYFWIFITIAAFEFGRVVNKKMTSHLFNPMLIATLIVGALIIGLGVEYSLYSSATAMVTSFLTPVTVILAVPIYRNREILKKHLLSIVIGTLVGSIVSLTSVYLLCKAFNLDEVITASLLPKSITSAIAIEVSAKLGGIQSITMFSLLIAGLQGSVTLPYFLKLFKVDNKIAKGLAIGTASHALGTSRAVELEDPIGAMSGLAIAFTGIFTVIISLFIS